MYSYIILPLIALIANADEMDYGYYYPIPQDFRRIARGQVATEGQYPFQVSLQKRNKNKHICGGSIISTKYVLTAAHCLYKKKKTRRPTSTMKVVVGRHFLSENKTGFEYDIQHSIEHPMHVGPFYDLAVLKINGEFKFLENIVMPITVTQNFSFSPGTEVLVTGYDTDTKLKYMKSKIIPFDECYNPIENIEKVMMCVETTVDGSSPCIGDSGGPVILRHERPFVQVGVIQSGIKIGNFWCSFYEPTSQTKITKDIYEWIRNYL